MRRKAWRAAKATQESSSARAVVSIGDGMLVADPAERDDGLEADGGVGVLDELQRDGSTAMGTFRRPHRPGGLGADVRLVGEKRFKIGMRRHGSAAGDGVERPDEMPAGQRRRLVIEKRGRDRLDRFLPLRDQRILRPHPFGVGGVVEWT